jgi:hypothetical protein
MSITKDGWKYLRQRLACQIILGPAVNLLKTRIDLHDDPLVISQDERE